MAKEEYIMSHDRVCAQLHFNIFIEIGIKLDNEHWYDYVPKSVKTNCAVKVLWNQQEQTDRTIPNNKPDIIIHDNEKGTCRQLYIISEDRSVIKKEADKILKYKDLIIEIQHVCNVKEKVIPVTTGATGTISKSLRQYWSNIPGKHKIKEL